MVTDLLGVILQELSKSLNIPNLHPDSNNSCLIKMPNGLEIQIELDRSRQFLLLGSDLGIVAPGKYRENLFKEALKANDMPHPIHGTLSYSKKSDHLVMFEKIQVTELNGEKIAAEITPFMEKALVWSDALKRGDIPVANQMHTSDKSSGMFGLKP